MRKQGTFFAVFCAFILLTSYLSLMTGPSMLYRSEISVEDENNAITVHEPSRDGSVTRDDVTLVQYDDVNMTINGTTFNPDSWAKIDVVGGNDKINGTVEWRLESPLETETVRDAGLNEVPFDFTRDVTGQFFDDPDFQNNVTLEDWYNDTSLSFDDIRVNSTLGEVNLTRFAGNNNEAILHYNKSVYSGSYLIQFQYKNFTDVDPLNFSYYNGEWVNTSLNTTASSWADFSLEIELSANATDADVFRFHLAARVIGGESIWSIRSLSIRYNYKKIPVSTNLQTGHISQQWQHRDFTEIINSTYSVERNDENQLSTLKIEIQLPLHSVYFGDWIFELIVTRKDVESAVMDPVTYSAPITIQENLEIDILSLYMQRGINTTDGENKSLYEEETGLNEVFSPGDRVIEIFSLSYASSPQPFNTTYYDDLTGFLNNTWSNSYANLIWGEDIEESALYRYDITAADIASGNFNNTEYNSSIYYSVRHDIPLRAIYGDVVRELNITFPSYNERSITDEFGDSIPLSRPYSATIELSNITVKYRMNITEENLPFKRQYLLTELIKGNFTVNIWNYNQTLESVYFTNSNDNRSINYALAIPATDLQLEIAVNQSDKKTLLTTSSSGYTFLWQAYLSPNLDTRKPIEIRIDRLDVKEYGDDPTLEFIQGRVDYDLIGGLRIELAENMIEEPVHQFSDLVFNFTVKLEEFNKSIHDLLLHAEIDDLDWRVSIIDNNGLFTCVVSIDDSFEVGKHVIHILKSSTGEELYSLTFYVDNPPDKVPKELENALLSLTGAAIFGLILLLFLVAVIFRRS